MIGTLKKYVDFAYKKKCEVREELNKIEANIKKLKYDIRERKTKNE